MNRQQFEEMLKKSVRNDRLRRLAKRLVKSWLSDEDRKMLQEKHGAGRDSAGKEGIPKSDHPLETIGRKPNHDFHKRPLGKMIADYKDAIGGGASDAVNHHKNKIKSYVDGMDKAAVKHNKDWLGEKLDDGSHQSWDLTHHVNKKAATYSSIKDFHDKHGSEETKKLFKEMSHNGPYVAAHTRPEDWKDHEGIKDSADHLTEEMYEAQHENHPKREEHDKRYEQSERDYKDHGYASKSYNDESATGDESIEKDKKAEIQYDKYKDLVGEDMWEGFKHKHSIKD